MTTIAILRTAAALALTAALAAPAPAPPAAGKGPCTCESEGACYDFLNAPVSAPEEDCPCAACIEGSRHTGRRVPEGWNPDCWNSGRLPCFLKRHAVSWEIACSECVAAAACCKTPHPDRCPLCGEGGSGSPWKERDLKILKAQVAVEQETFRDHLVVAFSPHFYLVTDIPVVKLRVRGGGLRPTDGHEYAHVMLMRAEAAYREFSEAIGRPSLRSPIAIYLPKGETTASKLRERYFRDRTTPMIYGSYGDATQTAIAGGFCFNGFCFSLQRGRGEDREMHQALRHYTAHILFTNWIRNIGENRTAPRWVFEGLAHWFGKRPPQLRDCAVYCGGEAEGTAGNPKGWEAELRREAGMDLLDPIEPILQKDSLGKLSFKDHMQTWGWFAAAMEMWRAPWVQLLADLRAEREVHDAFKRRLGVTPDQFQVLWKEWLLGKRASIVPGTGEAGEPRAGPPPEAVVASAKDPRELLARIREAGTPRTAEAVAALLDVYLKYDSDLAREAAGEGLRKAGSDEARRAVWQKGLVHPAPFARVYAARACLSLRIGEAIPALRPLLEDRVWLVRAEAAVALGGLGDRPSAPALRALCADPSPKARIAAMDALTGIADATGKEAVRLVCANLDHADWQVRIAACQCLAVIGTVDAVDPLIARMTIEAGRVRREIYLALKRITRDDLGADPASWRKWWSKEAPGAREKGFGPEKDPTDGGRYAVPTPTYYGIRLFSDRVGYVVDTSRSTERRFTPDPKLRARFLGQLPETTRILDIVQEEVARSVRALDPSVRFALVCFSDAVRQWKDGLQPATPADKENAAGFVRGTSPAGATNLQGALRTMLALGDADPYGPGFRDTPDTMTILTDGAPTAGEITDGNLLLAWYAGLNRYARIRTHVVVFGQLEVEEEFLSRLAGQNGGDYLQFIEFNPK